MATIVNDRDKSLQSVSPRLTSTSVVITAPSASFNKSGSGTFTPTSILLTATTTVFTSPTYSWEYSINTAPNTWTSLGSGSTQNITASTVDGIIGLATLITYRVTVTQTGFNTATATYIISWTAATSAAAFTHQLLPPNVHIGVDPDGDPYSLETATAEYTVTLDDVTDDTTNWTLSKVDYNVTSTLTSNVLQITDFATNNGTTYTTKSSPTSFGGSSDAIVNSHYTVFGRKCFYISGNLFTFPSDANTARNHYWKSTDNGVTWVKYTNFPTSYYYFYCVYHITSNNTLLVSTDQGTFVSTNMGTSWSNIATRAYVTWMYEVGSDLYSGSNHGSYQKSNIGALSTLTSITLTYDAATIHSLLGVSGGGGSMIDYPILANGIYVWPVRFIHTNNTSIAAGGLIKSTNGLNYVLCTGTAAYKQATEVYYSNVIFVNSKFIAVRYTTGTYDLEIVQGDSSANNWTLVSTVTLSSTSVGFWKISCINGIYYLGDTASTYYIKSTNLFDWVFLDRADPANPSTNFNAGTPICEATGSNWAVLTMPGTGGRSPILVTGGNLGTGVASYKLVDINIPSKTYGFVDVTASRTGYSSVTKRFEVFADNIASTVPVLANISPTVLTVDTYADGKVKAYGTGFIAGTVMVAGVVDTANWSISYVTSDPGLTITNTGTGTWTLTAMPDALDFGTITFTATKPGFSPQIGTIAVNKNKTDIPSGLRVTAFNGVTSLAEYVAIKFKTNGEVDVKYSSGGSFALLTNWYGPTTTNIGNTHYLMIESTGDALDGASSSLGAAGAFIQLNTDRTYILVRSTSGTSRADFKIYLATNSAGTGVTSYATTFLQATKV